MTTPQQPTPAPSEPPADLTFVAHDLGRDELVEQAAPPPPAALTADPQPPATAGPPRFHVVGSDAAAARRPAADQLPWTPRHLEPAEDARPSASPWTVRRTEQWTRSSTATVRRLRQEAVNLSWTAAWLAVTASEPAGTRRRRR